MSKYVIGGVALSAVLGFALSASGGIVTLGNSGWEAEWDDGLDPFVEIVFDSYDGEAVYIQKSAEYNPAMTTVPIVFRQIAENAAEYIVIEDEIITNNTGYNWIGFNMTLVNGNDAIFDPARTLASGGGGPIGWSIDPFTTAQFSGDLKQLDIGGGVVQDGDVWFPGNGPDDGQLWIDVVVGTGGDRTQFVLKETPIPGPGALALLAVGGLLGRRRRR